MASVVNGRLPTNSCVDVSRSMRGAGAASSLAVAHVRQADQATGAAAERLAAATPHRRAGPAATDSGRAATRGSARRATERARRIIGAVVRGQEQFNMDCEGRACDSRRQRGRAATRRQSARVTQ